MEAALKETLGRLVSERPQDPLKFLAEAMFEIGEPIPKTPKSIESAPDLGVTGLRSLAKKRRRRPRWQPPRDPACQDRGVQAGSFE